MKVALVHYWLVGMRGGEKVLETFCDIFPDADIFTLVADPAKLSPKLKRHKLTTSFLQKIGGRKHYQKMLPLMPYALEALDLTFLGSVSDEQMEAHFSNCRALLYPGVEDFGIVPLEVMASGRPVIAFGRGGALETVVEGKTGLFFHEQSVEALVAALARFERESDQFSPTEIRAHALKFEPRRFEAELRQFLAQLPKPATEAAWFKTPGLDVRKAKIGLVPQG